MADEVEAILKSGVEQVTSIRGEIQSKKRIGAEFSTS